MKKHEFRILCSLEMNEEIWIYRVNTRLKTVALVRSVRTWKKNNVKIPARTRLRTTLRFSHPWGILIFTNKKGCDYTTDEEKTHTFYLISKVPWLNFYWEYRSRSLSADDVAWSNGFDTPRKGFQNLVMITPRRLQQGCLLSEKSSRFPRAHVVGRVPIPCHR